MVRPLSLTASLAVGMAARQATAMPSSLFRRTDLSQQSSCFDLQNYQGENGVQLQSDMWDKVDASGYLSDWWNAHWGDANFVGDFANPLGIGQSFSCGMSAPCNRPDCTSLGQPGAPGTGPAYEVLVSLSNINLFLKAVRDSFFMSHDRWTGMQVAIQKTYWPQPDSSTLALREIIIALSASLGMVVGIASGVVGTIPKALGSTLSAMSGGAATAATNAIGAGTDNSLNYLASMEANTDAWYQGAMNTVNNLNDDLMSIGHHVFPDGSVVDIQPLLQGGAWLDYRNIPVLNTDASLPRVTSSDLNQLTYNLILGQLINYSWKQQAVWIVKYDMSEDDFNNFVSPSSNNDFRLKLYYGGSAFFFQGLVMNGNIPETRDPPGWGDLEGDLAGAVTSQDILRSSADAWHDYGYGQAFTLDNLPTGNPNDILATGLKSRGFWNIPICTAPTDIVKSVGDLAGFLQHDGDWYADGGPYGSNWCTCIQQTDANGVKFSDQFPSSWLDNMDPSCNPSNPYVPVY